MTALDYLILTRWFRFPKLMRGIPSLALETSIASKKCICISYVENVAYFMDYSLNALFITRAGIWCSLKYLFHTLPCTFVMPLQKMSLYFNHY